MNQSPEDTKPEDKPVIMNALLGEFNAIRAEIIFRATSQATLIQINIAAAGTVAVFALSDKTHALTMIVIPILSPVLGILWLDHDATIMKLGGFIKSELKSAYKRVVANFEFPDYESYAETKDALPVPRFAILNFTVAVFATFGVLPVAALLYVVYQFYQSNNLHSVPFLATAVLAILLLLMFLIQFVRRFGLSALFRR
jgi:hypothetical protein